MIDFGGLAISSKGKDFLTACLNFHPDERASLDLLTRHEYLQATKSEMESDEQSWKEDSGELIVHSTLSNELTMMLSESPHK